MSTSNSLTITNLTGSYLVVPGLGAIAASATVSYPISNAALETKVAQLEVLRGASSIRWHTNAWLNPRWFGAKGDGSTDDTAAFQAIFDVLGRNVGTGKTAITGGIFTPCGNYKITTTLTIIGDPGRGITWEGVQGQARDGQDGSCLVWGGASGGTLVHFRGMNGSTVRNMQFNGGNLAAVCFWASEYYDGSLLIGSSGLFFEHCFFNNPQNSTSAVLFKVGLDDGTTQDLEADSFRWFGCDFDGNGAAPCLAGIYIATPGNAKTYTMYHCNFTDTDFGFYQPSGSGVTTAIECQFSNIGYNQDGAALVMLSGNTLNVFSCGMENSNVGPDTVTPFRARMVHTDNGVTTNIVGGYVGGRTPADDYSMILGGPSTLHGFSFEFNSRAGSNVCKVLGGVFGLDLKSCDWAYNTTPLKNVPVYDGSNNHMLDTDVYRANTSLPASLTAEGCLSGLAGFTHSFQLPAVRMRRPAVICGSFSLDPANGINALVTHQDEDGRRRITVPYTAFVPLGTISATIRISQAANFRIRDVLTNFTVAFTGGATPVLSVGTEATHDILLTAHDASTTGIRGGKDQTYLGAGLLPGPTVHPCGYYLDSDYLHATLTLASGNVSTLTAGQVVITFLYDYVGL